MWPSFQPLTAEDLVYFTRYNIKPLGILPAAFGCHDGQIMNLISFYTHDGFHASFQNNLNEDTTQNCEILASIDETLEHIKDSDDYQSIRDTVFLLLLAFNHEQFKPMASLYSATQDSILDNFFPTFKRNRYELPKGLKKEHIQLALEMIMEIQKKRLTNKS